MLSDEEKAAIKTFCDASLELKAKDPAAAGLRRAAKENKARLDDVLKDGTAVALADGGYVVRRTQTSFHRAVTRETIEAAVRTFSTWPPPVDELVDALHQERGCPKATISTVKRLPKNATIVESTGAGEAFRAWKESVRRARAAEHARREAQKPVEERRRQAETLVTRFLQREQQSQRLNLAGSTYFMRLGRPRQKRRRTTRKVLAETVQALGGGGQSRQGFVNALVAALGATNGVDRPSVRLVKARA